MKGLTEVGAGAVGGGKRGGTVHLHPERAQAVQTPADPEETGAMQKIERGYGDLQDAQGTDKTGCSSHIQAKSADGRVCQGCPKCHVAGKRPDCRDLGRARAGDLQAALRPTCLVQHASPRLACVLPVIRPDERSNRNPKVLF